MTERTRMVLRRVVVEGASAAEVATQLSLTEGNVRVMRHRGLEALRKCMQGRLTWQAAS